MSFSSSSEEAEIVDQGVLLSVDEFYIREISSSSESADSPTSSDSESNTEDDEVSIQTSSSKSHGNSCERDSKTYSFSECRLCKALRLGGHETARDMYAINGSLELMTLSRQNVLCACPGVAEDEQAVHVMCLQRWIRVSFDRPCTACRRHLIAPPHLTRLDGFVQIMGTFFAWQCLLSLLLLNAYLFNELFWLMVSQWHDGMSATCGHFFATLSWLCRNVELPWTPYYLLLVPFMNVLLLQYFCLYYWTIKSDYSLIIFRYNFGHVEATQLYSAQMVASYYVRREEFKEGKVNYGSLWDNCSYCGRGLTPFEPYLRYICHCYAYHITCLRLVVNCEPSVEGQSISSSRCLNCSAHFKSSPFQSLLCLLCDALLRPRSRAMSVCEYFRQLFHHQQKQFSSWPRREPSFGRYFFATPIGRPKLLKFAVAFALYITAEIVVICPHQQSLWTVEHLASTLWLLIRLVWLAGEAVRLAYADYLMDFDAHQVQLQSHFVF